MKKKITPKFVIENLDAIITAVTLSICVVLVNINVIMRYFVNSPLRWCEEVVTALFVWTVFIGSAYAYRKHAHLGVDIVINMMNGKTKSTVRVIMSILELMVLVMLTVISAQYVFNLIYVRGVYKPYVTDMLRIPKWYSGLAVPVGFGLSTVYSVYFLLRDELHIIKKKDNEAENEHKVEGGNF